MLRYLTHKILYGFLVMLGIVTVIFLLFNVLPGDPARMMLGQRADSASIAAIRKDLGTDQSLGKQYLMYLNDVSPLSVHNHADRENIHYLDSAKYAPFSTIFSTDTKTLVFKYPYLRRSYQSKRKVTDVLAAAIPGTAILAFVSMIIATILGIALGVLSAIKKDGWMDKLSMIFAVFGMSLPSFVAAILAMWIFAYLLGDLTGLPVTGSLYEIDEFEGRKLVLKNMILPAITLGVRPLSIILQLTRSSMLDVLSQDYIRTATAKGLSYYVIVLRHALLNALNPVITAISGWLASLMAGAVFVEIVFGWKGIGLVILDALGKYDLPVVMGAVLLVSVFFVLINIVVDILYGLVDPRVRVG